ncbi:MAG: flippase-like domain-containing protein [Rickettsiales bacterium]|nr:flippase-like domain-containing protein [Rickettsiales bacterium]
MTDFSSPEAETLSTPSTKKRYMLVVLKTIFTIGALYFVFSRTDFSTITSHLRDIQLGYMFAAFVALTISQIVSGMRMRHYFASAGYTFSPFFCISIYFVGAFFNIVLPGGISSDRYKAWLLKRHFQIPILRSLRLILSERANGLFLLLIYALGFAALGTIVPRFSRGLTLLEMAFLLLVPVYFLSVRLVLKEHFQTSIKACMFSAISQGFIALCAFLIFQGLSIGEAIFDYQSLFMISCVVAIIPVSIGGAGMRELTFFYGLPLAGLDVEAGIAAALLFFVVHVSTSLIGLAFWGRIRPQDAEALTH